MALPPVFSQNDARLSVQNSLALNFRLWQREFARAALRLKLAVLMGAIAERLVFGKAAAAQRNNGPAAQSIEISLRIMDTEFAFQANGSVIDDRYFHAAFPPMVAKASHRALYNSHAGLICVIQFIHDSDKKLFEDAIGFAQRQVKRLIEAHPAFYPMYTQAGKWKHDGPVWMPWCDGFLPGTMFIFARHLGGEKPEAKWWLDQAIRYT